MKISNPHSEFNRKKTERISVRLPNERVAFSLMMVGKLSAIQYFNDKLINDTINTSHKICIQDTQQI